MTRLFPFACAAALAASMSFPACSQIAARTTGEAVYDAELTEAISEAVKPVIAPQTTSILVMQSDDVLLEMYPGDGAPDLLNNTRSATKTVVAMAVGAAIEDGYFKSVDDKVWPLLEDKAPEGAGDALTHEMTLRDLMTMSSALHCNDSEDTPGNENYMHEQEVWLPWALSLPSSPGWSRDESGLGPWRYCTVGSFLVGQAIEAASGVKVDEYVRQKIFEPLNIEDYEWFYSPGGEVQTGGGLELTARDLAKLGKLLTDGGVWKGEQVLPAEWVDEMMTVHRRRSDGKGYGYLIWQQEHETSCGPVDAWFMSGNGGNRVLSLKSLDAVVVLTRQAYNTRGMHQQTDDLLEDYIIPPLTCAAD
ncbi:serine hydrolase [Henriciella sp. AS95]|uniref:serine hydrolase domain-containing protein n=1 Tax=Henriciella sp. AS95 TaxID=3135782 RepID=UPI00316F1D88